MRHANVHVFVHYVWATWDRLPLLTSDIREEAYRLILGKCSELDVESLALGGIEDHMHLLVRLPATVTIAKAVADIKGFSAHAIAHKYKERLFKWQGGYGAFSVSDHDVATIQSYIRNQATHHTIATCSEYRAVEDTIE